MTKENLIAAHKRTSEWLARTYEEENMAACLDAYRILDNLKATIEKRTAGDEVNLTYGQLERLTSAFINEARRKNNRLAAEAVFSIFTDLKGAYEEDKKLVLGYYRPFLKDLSEDEKEIAVGYLSKKMSGKVDKEYIHELQYKGLKLVEYLGEAYSMDDDKEFTLDWDWWYPIDRYIYLEKDWKNAK